MAKDTNKIAAAANLRKATIHDTDRANDKLAKSKDDLREAQGKMRLADFVQDDDKTFPSETGVALDIISNVKAIYAAKSPYDMINAQKEMLNAQKNYITEQKEATKYMKAWVSSTNSENLASVTEKIEKHKQNMANYEALMKESSANLLAYAESNAEEINPTELELIRARQKSIEAQNSLISEFSKVMELEINSAKAEVEGKGEGIDNAQKALEESKKRIKRAEEAFSKTEAAVKEITDDKPDLVGDAGGFDKSVGEVQLQKGLAKQWSEVANKDPLPEELFPSKAPLAQTVGQTAAQPVPPAKTSQSAEPAAQTAANPSQTAGQPEPGVGGADGLVIQPKGPVVSRNPNLAKQIQDTITKALEEYPVDKDTGGKVANQRVYKIFEGERSSNRLVDVAPELFGGTSGVGPDSTKNNLNIFEINLDKMAQDKVPGTCMFVPRNDKNGKPVTNKDTGEIIQDVIYFNDKGEPTGLDIMHPEPPPTSIGPKTIEALEKKFELEPERIRRTTPLATKISAPKMAKGPTQGQGLGPTPSGPKPPGPAPQPNPAFHAQQQIEEALQQLLAAEVIFEANSAAVVGAEGVVSSQRTTEQQNLIALRDQVQGGYSLIPKELRPEELKQNKGLTAAQVSKLAADLAKSQAFDATKFNLLATQARLSSEAVKQQGKSAAPAKSAAAKASSEPTGQHVGVATNTAAASSSFAGDNSNPLANTDNGYLEVNGTVIDEANPTRTVSSDSGNDTGSEDGGPYETEVDTEIAQKADQPGVEKGDRLLREAVNTEQQEQQAVQETDRPFVEKVPEAKAAAGHETDLAKQNGPTEQEQKKLEEQAKRDAEKAELEEERKKSEALGNGTGGAGLADKEAERKSKIKQNQIERMDSSASNKSGVFGEKAHVQGVLPDGPTHYYPADESEPPVEHDPLAHENVDNISTQQGERRWSNTTSGGQIASDGGMLYDSASANNGPETGAIPAEGFYNQDSLGHVADEHGVQPADENDQPIVIPDIYDEVGSVRQNFTNEYDLASDRARVSETPRGADAEHQRSNSSLAGRMSAFGTSQPTPTRMVDQADTVGHNVGETTGVHEAAINRSNSTPAAGDKYKDNGHAAAQSPSLEQRAQSFSGPGNAKEVDAEKAARRMSESFTGNPPGTGTADLTVGKPTGSHSASPTTGSPKADRRNSQDKGSKIGDG